jgi:UbiD family decarboxylase
MALMDLRDWIAQLDAAKEVRHIGAEVHWDCELGAVARRVLEKRGPALLFESITDYKEGPATQVFTGSYGTRKRLALALGLPPDVTNTEIVQYVMKKNQERIKPVLVETGPVKENIVKGEKVDQTIFPVPRWGHRDGGRYIHTFSHIVTRDPETGVMNVGMYRGMVGKKDTTPMLLIKGGQHWGQHFNKYAERGEEMPVACVIGGDPILPFLSGSPLPAGVCEWDVLGAYRGEPVQLVQCETVDLEVPANAEIVIEGFISDAPDRLELEGPFGEFTGYVSDLPTPRPSMRITCITYRNKPIFQGTLEGTLPGSFSENSVMSSVQRAAIAWNILKNAGIPSITDVYVHPITNGTNICVQIKKQYQGQPKQIAAALWGSSAAQYRYKHVFVAEDDIDISSYEQLDWAMAYRMNALEDGIVVFPGTFGSPIDPSTPLHDRNIQQLGSGLWNRVLFDMTRNWRFERQSKWDNERFPPTVRPAPEDEAKVKARWPEYGLADL